jgi:hypothetical protein
MHHGGQEARSAAPLEQIALRSSQADRMLIRTEDQRWLNAYLHYKTLSSWEAHFWTSTTIFNLSPFQQLSDGSSDYS